MLHREGSPTGMTDEPWRVIYGIVIRIEPADVEGEQGRIPEFVAWSRDEEQQGELCSARNLLPLLKTSNATYHDSSPNQSTVTCRKQLDSDLPERSALS